MQKPQAEQVQFNVVFQKRHWCQGGPGSKPEHHSDRQIQSPEKCEGPENTEEHMRQEHQDQERGKNDRSGEVKRLREGKAIKCGGKRTKSEEV